LDKAIASTMVTTTTLVILFAAELAFSIGAAVSSSSSSNIGMQSQATGQEQQSEEIYRIQETAMSSAAPVEHTGNLPHAVVFALPIREMERSILVRSHLQQASP
jgi:hypothetical protein